MPMIPRLNAAQHVNRCNVWLFVLAQTTGTIESATSRIKCYICVIARVNSEYRRRSYVAPDLSLIKKLLEFVLLKK